MTRKEREVQQKLRRIALIERGKKEEYVRVGMGRIFLEGKWWAWNEEREELEEWESEGLGGERGNEGSEQRGSIEQDSEQGSSEEEGGSREKIDLR